MDDQSKQNIIDLFRNNVKDREVQVGSGVNEKHCGKEGHWLETAMGVQHNSKNAPDLYGFEMKKESAKITYGDFSASEYLFSKRSDALSAANKQIIQLTRSQFMRSFGKPNEKKNNRYAWSGKCFPKLNQWNGFGQQINVTDTNDIVIYYSHEHDTRSDKHTLPDALKQANPVMIAIWKSEKLRNQIDKKFNVNGFFICKKDASTGKYNKICFGKPFDFDFFIEQFKNGAIIIDSGMKDSNGEKKNTRNYSMFRSNKNTWQGLIIEEYE